MEFTWNLKWPFHSRGPDPTKHSFWYPACIGSWKQLVRSLHLCGLLGLQIDYCPRKVGYLAADFVAPVSELEVLKSFRDQFHVSLAVFDALYTPASHLSPVVALSVELFFRAFFLADWRARDALSGFTISYLGLDKGLLRNL